MDEFVKLEKVLQGLQACQSFVGWMLDALSTEIKRTDFEPVDATLFDGIKKFLGGAMVESMSLSSSLFAFLRLRRREHYARDFPTSLSDEQRKALLSSSLSIEKLFDNALLLEFAEDQSNQASKSANIEMAKSIPKLTSAMTSSSSSRRDRRTQYKQSSSRRDRRTPPTRRDRRYSPPSRENRDRPSQSRSQERGSSNRGRFTSRGTRRPNRGNSRDRPLPSRSNFRK